MAKRTETIADYRVRFITYGTEPELHKSQVHIFDSDTCVAAGIVWRPSSKWACQLTVPDGSPGIELWGFPTRWGVVETAMWALGLG